MAVSDYWNVNPSSSFTFTPDTSAKTQSYYDMVKANNPAYYDTIKNEDPMYQLQQQLAAKDAQLAAATSAAAGGPATATPTGPQVALKQFNDALGQGFESRYLPDTLDDPFVNTAFTSQRSKADDFINNMLKRGTLTEAGRGNAVRALDTQSGGVRSKLDALSNALLQGDRTNLTNLANEKRGLAQQTPVGTTFDPSPLVNEIAQTGQGYASSFGDRFNASLPPGDLFDTASLAGAGGGVTSPSNVSFDPYAQEGGTLKTGLDDSGTQPVQNKRRTTVF